MVSARLGDRGCDRGREGEKALKSAILREGERNGEGGRKLERAGGSKEKDTL